MENKHEKMISLAVSFVNATEMGNDTEAAEEHDLPNAKQKEFPDLLTKIVAAGNLNDLKLASIKYNQVKSIQSCKIVKIYATNDLVILELTWLSTLAVVIGNTKRGDVMQAWVAQFFEFNGGKVHLQSNYNFEVKQARVHLT